MSGSPLPIVERLGSLADETRLRLLLVLEQAELSVAELCDVLQLPQSTVSRHLKLLADQRWIRSRRAGTARLYRMDSASLDEGAAALWSTARQAGAAWSRARHDRHRLEAVRRRRERAEAFFSRSAARWEEVRQELYGHGYVNAALAALLPADWEVADLGCGTGRLARLLAARVRRVLAVDASPAMLDAARRELAGTDNVELIQADLADLPLEDGRVDAALMLLALTWADDPPAVVGEAARILRPGGRLVVVDLLAHDRADFRETMGHAQSGFEPEALADALTAAGLAAPRVETLPAEPRARGPALLLATADRPAAGAD
ncbi:MAG: methyltransferase domain-containing protein [Acidobacteria bacterium]|nr:MAG: methyltransferase domain-containing protein [Acidobacteriota bacterium]